MAYKRPFQSEESFGLQQMRKRAGRALAQNKFGKTEAEKERETEAAFQKGAQQVGNVATQINAAGLGQGITGGQGSRTLTDLGSQFGELGVKARTGVEDASAKLAFDQQREAERLAKEAEAERQAKRARVGKAIAGVGSALLLPGMPQVAGALGGLAARKAPGSTGQKALAAAGQYAKNLGDWYDPRNRKKSGGTGGD